MKIGIIGSWHLGLIYSNVLASKGHQVTVYDPGESNIDNLNNGQMPIYETDLQELLRTNLEKKNIFFTSDPSHFSDFSVLWICFDAPIDNEDKIDLEKFRLDLDPILDSYKGCGEMIISSQLPIGTSRKLSNELKERKIDLKVSYSPENLRLGSSIRYLMDPDRIIIGIESEDQKAKLKPIFETMTSKLLWMSLESSELTKHAINSLLAMEVAFANELGVLSQLYGANSHDVSAGVKSDERIGPKAYLNSGNPFSGGTLARDLRILEEGFEKISWKNSLASTVLASNSNQIKLLTKYILKESSLNGTDGSVSIIGLVYKSGTDILRRSLGIEIGTLLHDQGVHVKGYDELLGSTVSIFPIERIKNLGKSGTFLILNKYESLEDWIRQIGCDSTVIDLQGFYCENKKLTKGNYVTFSNGKYVTQ